MIRINLLPVRAAKKRELGRIQIAIGVMVLLATGGVNYFWQQSEEKKLADVRRQVDRTKAEIRQLEEIIGQVKDIEERKKHVGEKLAVLDELRAGKTGPVMMMDSLAMLIPTEVWISRFTESGLSLSLDGEALGHEDLAAFISALNESPYFKDVRLRQANTQRSGDRPVVRFSIEGQVVYQADVG